MNYFEEEHVQHLILALKEHFTILEDWTGNLYYGITLKWEYEKIILDFFMPAGYIKNVLQ